MPVPGSGSIQLRIRVVGRIAHVRIDDQARRVEGRGMDFEVDVVVGGAAGVADERDDVAGFDALANLHEQPGVVVIDREDIKAC